MDGVVLTIKEGKNELETRAYAAQNAVNKGGELVEYVSDMEANEIKMKIQAQIIDWLYGLPDIHKIKEDALQAKLAELENIVKDAKERQCYQQNVPKWIKEYEVERDQIYAYC